MPYRTSPEMAERMRSRRARLLAAAVKLFGRYGYHSTTVPRICRQARSSTGGFYFYFRNKEDVFGAALDEAAEGLGQALDKASARSAGPRAKVRALSERFFLWMSENPREARILLLESSGLSPKLEARRRRVLDAQAARFEVALEGAVTSRKDRSAAARCFLGASLESARHWLQSPAAERDPASRAAARLGRLQVRSVA